MRSLISAQGQNVVYFPTGTGNIQVQRLDTRTCATETIAVLPFLPRCLVAKHGWTCSGGERGEFVTIDRTEANSADHHDLATDLDLALSVDPTLDTDPDPASNPQVRQTIRSLLSAPKQESKKVGKDRVNCITLWFPPQHEHEHIHEGAYDQAVAVLANNDKSVSIVSLAFQDIKDEIRYPDCVNRAVISPDGGLLVAVSDDPYLYVHERCEKSVETPDGFWPDGTAYRWRLRHKIHLISQSRDDRSDNRGSFAACFSSSGRYLAVGTQYGVISIFDATTLANPSFPSLITSFKSSRPGVPSGAVRAMEFAPGPMDLLAWTEDRGRVGVADMRNGCISRQIIHLDEEDGYDHITLTDRGAIDPRLTDILSGDLQDNLASSLATTLDFSPEPRTGLERLNQPLSRDETIVLEALQEHSRRRVQRAAERVSTTTQRLLGTERDTPAGTGTHLRNANAQVRRTMGPQATSIGPDTTTTNPRLSDAQRDRRAEMDRQQAILLTRSIAIERERDRTAQELDRLRDVHGHGETRHEARLRELSALIRANAADSATSAERRQSANSSPAVPPPPMRSSPTIANTNANADDEVAAHIAARRNITARIMANYPSSSGPGNAWGDLETLYNLSLDHGIPSYEGLRSAVDADARRRDRAAFLIREWETNPGRRAGMHMRREIEADPHDTAGLAWSDDGRTLYVYPIKSFVPGTLLTPIIGSLAPRMAFTSFTSTYSTASSIQQRTCGEDGATGYDNHLNEFT